jgi:nucleoside 2-deoxyribosyltransferase
MKSSYTKAYIAGPLFNVHEIDWLEQISAICEAFGILTFLPHRDAPNMGNKPAIEIFTADENGLYSCDFTIATLDGYDVDSGTAVEIGMSYVRGMPVLGITTDSRQVSHINAMPLAICEMGLGVVHSLPELIEKLSEIMYSIKVAEQ